jgi:hypothetical protein
MFDTAKVHKADYDFPFDIWRFSVPGGWLYHSQSLDGFVSVIFVPAVAETNGQGPSKSGFVPLAQKE